MTQVEILAIGNEVLSGDVVDTNSNWLARQATQRGGQVRRITAIPDTVDQVAQATREALGRRVDVLLCTGGLGPTVDDLTLAGIAEGLGWPLVEDDAALEMIEQRFGDLAQRGHVSPGLTDARRKMARLPRGATPLWNPVGTAPGVFLAVEGAAILVMPGVPEEMRAIFQASLTEVLAGRLPLAFAERAGLAHTQDDSLLAPHHAQISRAFPDVYVKTRVQAFGLSPTILVTFAASAPSQSEAQARVDAAFEALREALAGAGIPLDPAPP